MKPFTVFVCSTHDDLVQERESVLDAILRLKQQHDSMEYFGARAERPIEVCLKEVGASDVLVVIVGHRYGSIVPGLGISYSEAEYTEAVRLTKPCLVYLRDENVPVLPKDMERDPEKFKLLENWKQTLGGQVAYKFKSGADLALQVTADLSRMITAGVEAAVEAAPDADRVRSNLRFFSLGTLFKGRDDDLTRLGLQLSQGGAKSVAQPIAIIGMGGVGKTRLALEYAWRHVNDFSALLFVSANTPQDLDTNFAHLAEPDTLALPAYQGGNQAEQHAAVLAWLQQRKRWLLILDNVDTPEAVTAVKNLVARLYGGQVVITSRFTGAKWGNAIRQVSLKVVPLNDAVALLLESTDERRPTREDDAQQAGLLAQKLGCLPLALTHASAYIREQYQPIEGYSAEFERNLGKVLAYDDHDAIEYDKTIATTFSISFDRLGAMEKTILRAASFLAAEPIPIAMLEDSPDETKALVELWCEETHEEPEEKPVREALADLARFSLVERSDNAFSVHRMESVVLRSTVSPALVPKWVEATRAVLVHYAPDETAENPTTWQIWDKLRPHAEALVAPELADSGVKPHLVLMEALGQLYYGKGNYAQSLAIDEASLAIAEKEYAPDSGDLAHRFLCYGESLHQLGRNAEAEVAFRKSLAIRELNEPGSLRVAEDLNYVAIAVDNQGRTDEAISLQRQAIAIFEAHIDEADKGSFAKSLSNLGNLVSAKGNLEEAEALKRRALQYAEEGFSPEHPKTMICVATLAFLLETKGDLEEAEQLFRRAKEGCEKYLGMDHPITLNTMAAYGRLLEKIGRFDEAIALESVSIEALERRLGPKHPDTLRNWNNYAVILRRQGLAAQAEPIVQRVYEATVETLGVTYPLTVHRRNNVALTFIMLGKLAEASRVLTDNWNLKAQPYANTTPCIPFFRYLITLLEAQPDTSFLGQLKTILTGPELPRTTDVAVPWDIGYLIEFLRPKLPPGSPELLTGLLAAVNDRSKLPELDQFPEWRDQPAIPLDTPWPGE